jgi:DNA-binding SARP family transcriptional activator/Tfp pilus assembly protein PilF
MIDLRTLGALDLRSDDGRDVHALLRQPKRAALFTYLALAASRDFQRRDTILALFWPDLDQAHARGALRQALRFLRRTLGDDVVITRGEEEIRIDPAIASVDARAFEQLFKEGRMADALALYGGDFLDGFFLSEAGPGFDQWIDQERVRLRNTAARAAWALAEERRAAGDLTGALEMARRAAGFSPDSEADAARVIAFLDGSGDRAGALAAYDALAKRIRSDFDAEPAPETRALIEGIRARTDITAGAVASVPALGTPNAVDTGIAQRRAAQPYPRRLLVALAAIGVVAVSGYLVAFSARTAGRKRPSGPDSTFYNPADTTLTENAGARIDPRARRLYIKARYWWSRRGPANLFKAIATYQQALDIDPTYAVAFSGMGDAYAQLGYGGYLRPDDAFPKAKAAAQQALALDSTIAEPHATLGWVAMYYDWKWNEAEREYRRALALNPNYPTAHEWYGLFLAAMGRFREAQAEEKRAMKLDPLSLGIAATAGWVLHYSGKQAEAERQLRSALRMDSSFAIAHLYLGRVLQFNGLPDSALAHFAATGALRAWVPNIAGEGYVYAEQGRADRARAVLEQLDSLSDSQYVTPYAVALVHAALGQPDSAFTWLDKAVEERAHWLLWLNRDRRWDPIRSDPRFRSLTARVGVPK